MYTRRIVFNKEYILNQVEFGLTNDIVGWVEHDELVEVVNDVYRRIEESLLDVDVPDEFLDPIMSTQIKEPVFLPDTDVIMDKSVISTHLLSNKTNPFTRGELTLDMLEEYNARRRCS